MNGNDRKLRPTVFVGSSSEGLKVARSVQVLLDHACEVTIWSQGIFGLSEGTLESLVRALNNFDFAVLVLTPDDLVESRGEGRPAPRDNVLLELGLCIGALGRQRTFALYDRSSKIKLPSDLAGVTIATYEQHISGNLRATLGAPCTLIEEAIDRLGCRPGREFPQSTQKSADDTQVLCATAFEMGWLAFCVITKNSSDGTNPDVEAAELRGYLDQFGVRLGQPLTRYLEEPDSGASLMRFVSAVAGQLRARHPTVLQYFLAAHNVLVAAGREQSAKAMKQAVEKIALPDELKEPSTDRLLWVNRLHQHFFRVRTGQEPDEPL